MFDSGTDTLSRLEPFRLAGVLRTLTRRHHVPGAQLAVHEAGATVAVETGELAHGTGRRVTRQAAFPIGSVSKSFTASLAMILAAEGDLELDVPVGEYLPELRDLGAGCTVERLLSHSAGFAADPDAEVTDRVSRRRYVQEYCRRRMLIQPPGAGFSYSNLGYVLAGHLIEVVTGMGWSEAMESILLRPLGIDPVFVNAAGPSRSGGPAGAGGSTAGGGGSGGPAARPVATGHSVQVTGGRTRPVQQCLSLAEAPAGGLAVSAADLVALGLLHVPPGMPGLLPATAADRMRRAVPVAERFDIADGWALGLGIFRPGPVEWFGHDGNGNGTACYFRVDPAGGRAVALTSNASTGYDLWQDLLDEFGRAGLPISRHRSRTSTRSVPAPAGCPGSYRNGDLEYVVSGTPDGLLRIAVDGDRFDRVACHDDLTFSLPDPASAHRAVTGRFVRDPVSGRIDGLLLGGRLARRKAAPARDNRSRLTA